MRGQDQHKVTSATSFPLRYAHIDHVIKSCIRSTMDCQSHTASRSANYPNTTSTAHSKFQCGSSSSKMCFTILRPVMPRTTATAAGLGGMQTSLSSRLAKFVWPRGSWIRRRTPKKPAERLRGHIPMEVVLPQVSFFFTCQSRWGIEAAGFLGVQRRN